MGSGYSDTRTDSYLIYRLIVSPDTLISNNSHAHTCTCKMQIINILWYELCHYSEKNFMYPSLVMRTWRNRNENLEEQTAALINLTFMKAKS